MLASARTLWASRLSRSARLSHIASAGPALVRTSGFMSQRRLTFSPKSVGQSSGRDRLESYFFPFFLLLLVLRLGDRVVEPGDVFRPLGLLLRGVGDGLFLGA